MAAPRSPSQSRAVALDRAGRNLADAIAAAGLRVSTAEFVELAATALRRTRRRPLVDPATDIDPDTRRMFEEGGLTFAPLASGDDRSITDTAAEFAQLVAGSGTVKEVAARLGLTDGRVRQMLRARDLLAIREGDAWRVPWFQFDGPRPVRGLDRVMHALPADIHPVAAARLLDTPNPDLELAGRVVSPLDWLRSGADPGPVIELAADL
jgi:excisionase family DNA binding protein